MVEAAREEEAEVADDALVARIARGDEDALRVLYRRYAPLLFTLASRLVDRPSAEEITQDVFVALWQKHETFDPTKGTLKSGLCQIARRKAANARRHGKARRAGDHDSDDSISALASEDLLPDEARWSAQRREALRGALEALPKEQRTALTLAFFDELSHEEVAARVGVPLGTTKTRIRGGMKRLGVLLALVAAVTAIAIWQVGVRRDEEKRTADRQRTERALRMVTASDVVPLHLVPPGSPASPPPAVHGSYRARPGTNVAVLTTSALPAPESGFELDAWARHGDHWLLLGRVISGEDGRAVLVAEAPELTTTPLEVVVTPEREGSAAGAQAPSGAPLLGWPAR